MLGAEYLRLVGQYADELDRVHEGLTGVIRAGMASSCPVSISHYVGEAAQLRRFLG